MGIKKRSFEQLVEEIELQTIATESKLSTNDEAKQDQIAMYRLGAFVAGCNGDQPHPKDVATEALLAGVRTVMNVDNEFGRIEKFYRDRIRSPLTAIRAFCVMNEGGPKKANECTSVTCPLWLFRQGSNAFYGKVSDKELRDAEKDD